jgi:hypothetical protein
MAKAAGYGGETQMHKISAKWLTFGLASCALAFPALSVTAQVSPAPAVQRPVSRPAMPKPVARPQPARPATKPARPAPQQTRPAPKPAKPSANRPTTLPSYPNRPGAERPKPLPNRPGVNRPVTLPSYPNRPGLERPPVRPSRPIFRPAWGYQYPAGGRYFAGTIRCESYNGRFRSCYAPTRGHVVLERRHNGRCRYGNGWGYDRNRIWVSNSCRATFAYGYGSYIPRYRSDNNDAALIIGGVAVAAGLIAILSRDGYDDRNRPSQAATIEADLTQVESRAREGMRACLDRAASNIGATGGSRIRLDGVTIDAMGGKTYRYDTDIRVTYPDRRYSISYSCTANGSEVDDFDFVVED